MCLLLDELSGFFAKSIAPLLSSNTPILGDPRLGIKRTNTLLTYSFLHRIVHRYVLGLSGGQRNALLRPREPGHKRTSAADSYTRNRTSILDLVGIVCVYVRLYIVLQLYILQPNLPSERQTQVDCSASTRESP